MEGKGAEDKLGLALIDQKMRAERHKSNFETLRAQYVGLKESYETKQLEYDDLVESYDLLNQNSQSIIKTVQAERDEKILEMENLKAQVPSGAKLEQLKAKLSAEVIEPYKKHVDATEYELEALKNEHKKLKYEHILLGSVYDSCKLSHQTAIQKLNAKYSFEIGSLAEEKKNLMDACRGSDVPSHLNKIRHLEKINTELMQKMKSLIGEMEKMEAEREIAEEQYQQAMLLLPQQLAELQALNKTIELERSSLADQNHSIQAELTQSYQKQHQLSKKLVTAERQVNESRRRMEELEHSHSMEISDLEMKHMEEKQELQCAKDMCISEHIACKTELEAMSAAIQEHNILLANKEQQLELRVQRAREKEWEKQVALEREKIDLAEKVASLQMEKSRSLESHQEYRNKLQSALTEANATINMLESELETAKCQVQEASDKLQPALKEAEDVAQVKRKYLALSTEHRNLQALQTELQESVKKWEGVVEHLEEKLCKTKQAAALTEQQYQEEAERAEKSWEETNRELMQRLDECQESQKTSTQKFENMSKYCKRMQKHYRKKVHTLKEALELASAEKEEVKTKREAMVTALKLDNKKLRSQIAEEQRKKEEFSYVLRSDPNSLPRCPISEQEIVDSQQTQELERLNERLEELETNHTQQLNRQHQALLNIALLSSPPLYTCTSPPHLSTPPIPLHDSLIHSLSQ